MLAVLLALPARITSGRWARRGYLGTLLVAGVLVVVGGHYGGTLVHGEGYLTDVLEGIPPEPVEVVERPPTITPPPVARPPKPDPVTPDPVTPVIAVDFDLPDEVQAGLIEPILESHCSRCHGARRQKAGLQLVPVSAAFTGPRDTWVIRPGAPDNSTILERIRLPEGHPDLMPRGAEPLDPKSIALITRWIEQGAPAAPAPPTPPNTVPAVTPPTPEPKSDPTPPQPEPAPEPKSDPTTPKPEPAPKPEPKPEPTPEPEATEPVTGANQAAIDALIARGAVITRISALTTDLDVNLSGLQPPAADTDLPIVAGLDGDIVWLNLAGSDVTDIGLKIVGSFKSLQRLRLEKTPITDAGMRFLTGLQKLKYLNLHSTDVSDAGLESLGLLPKLERLYLWQTKVTFSGVAKLRVKLPKLRIIRSEPTDEATGQKEASAGG